MYSGQIKQGNCIMEFYENINITGRGLFSPGKRSKYANPLRIIWSEVINDICIYFIWIHSYTNVLIFDLRDPGCAPYSSRCRTDNVN